MKRFFLISLSILCLCLTSNAQETPAEKKDPATFKPEAGDFGLGIDALPYINFIGNIFGKTDKNTLNLNEQTIYGKYFLTNTSAIRVSLSTGFSKTNEYVYTNDDALRAEDPASTAQVTDLLTSKDNNLAISLGYEIRKDKGRWTFLYGAQAIYAYGRYSDAYTYGNPMSEVNQQPSINLGYYNSNGARVISYDSGISSTIGLGGFVGLECFVAPKISIGADFTLNYNYTFASQSDGTYEQWNGSQAYEFTTPVSPGDTGSSLETSQYGAGYGGKIAINFYF